MFQNLLRRIRECMEVDSKLSTCELRIFGRTANSLSSYELREHYLIKPDQPDRRAVRRDRRSFVRVTALCQTDTEGEALVRPMIDEIVAGLGVVVFLHRRPSPCPQTCARILTDDHLTSPLRESVHGRGGRVRAPSCRDTRQETKFLWKAASRIRTSEARRLGVEGGGKRLPRSGAGQRTVCVRNGGRHAAFSGAKSYALATTGFAGPDGGTAKTGRHGYIALATQTATEVSVFPLLANAPASVKVARCTRFDLLRRGAVANNCARPIKADLKCRNHCTNR